MKWAKTPGGSKYHAIVDDRSLCYCPLLADKAEFVEQPPLEDRCENCDKEWRRRGRESKPRNTRKGVNKGNTKTLYNPRHRFKDWT